MNLFVDILFFAIKATLELFTKSLNKINGSSSKMGTRENDESWVILDDFGRDQKDCDNSDPYLNGDFDDGPDW